MTHALTYAATLLVFLTLDAVYLTFVGGPLYTATIGDLLVKDFRIVPAVLFYLLHVAGIMVLVLPLARHQGGRWAAAVYGAVFGFCAYGTFDLTSHAVFRGWTWQLTVVDMIWGAVVTGAAAAAGAMVSRRRGG